MAEFELDNDKLRVIWDGPWSFNKNLILVKDFVGSQQVKNIKMVEALFWIRVYNLPLSAWNEYIGRLIGNSLGKFKEIDLDNGEVEWREFMRVRVNLAITRPLLRHKKLSIRPASVWVYFKYEQLLDFYFCYGRLSLGHKDCQ